MTNSRTSSAPRPSLSERAFALRLTAVIAAVLIGAGVLAAAVELLAVWSVPAAIAVFGVGAAGFWTAFFAVLIPRAFPLD